MNYFKQLFLLLLVFSIRSFAQISPGELTRSHAGLEGLSNCTKCHVLGEHVEKSKCMDCHTEIRQSIAANRGYHSTAGVRGKNCWSCHSEHHGRNFKILKFEKKNFDHSQTGFQLTGRHSQINCEDCHQAKFIARDELKKKRTTFLGLEGRCNACHTDYHQATLGDKCQACHNTISFKPAVYFNHNQAKFRLAGAHLKADCGKCHIREKRNGQAFRRFTGLNFFSCTSCHKDFHDGKLGRDCQKCHSTSSFRSANKLVFDHDKTGFPLKGKHGGLSCEKCHRNGDYRVKLSYDKCYNCHSDFHKGDFTVNNIQKDCQVCHSVEGFTPSNITIEEHNKIRFALVGSHLALSCRSCHMTNNEWHFRLEGTKCISCHTNIHGVELTSKFMPENNCESCHSTETWHRVNFNHSTTAFELKDRHAEQDCRKCHYSEESKQYRFASTVSDCQSCHKDVHAGQFIVGDTTNCMRCHTFRNWRPDNFNHELTRFSLTGGHRNVPCIRCHPAVQIADMKYSKYKLSEIKCSDCHKA